MTKRQEVFSGATIETSNVNLISQVEENMALSNLPDGLVRPGDKVVMIGASVIDTILKIGKLVENNGSILIVENNERYLQRAEELSSEMERKLGYSNWRFIQAEGDDLRTDPDAVNKFLDQQPANDFNTYKLFDFTLEKQRTNNPLVQSESVDVVILDMTLNRLPSWSRKKVLKEAFRILRPAGRIVSAVLLSDEVIQEIPNLPEGYSFNIGLEKEIFGWLKEAGFYGMRYLWQENTPIKVIEGTEIRMFLVEGYRPKQIICMDYGDAVIYPGPWSEVYDDDGHKFVRGERMALCKKTYTVMSQEPYLDQFIYIPSYVNVPDEEATLFDCNTPQIRDPKVTKGRKSTKECKSNDDGSASELCACKTFGNNES